MAGHVFPAEPVFAEQTAAAARSGFPWQRPPVVAELKAEARKRGLWNLFLAHHPAGAGLSNLQYAPLAEITGHSPAIAPEALNCAAPDTGNMELLAEFGTQEQREQWLRPLLDGEIRSAFCMTEPDVASSDATNIATRIERDGGNGPGLPDPHRDGQDRSRRGPAPAAVDDPGAAGHPGGHRPAGAEPVRV